MNLTKTACTLFAVLLATVALAGCEQKDPNLVKAEKDSQKRASANLAAHEKRQQ